MKKKPNTVKGLNLSPYDSLNANICIIDDTGMIVAVNKAWRDFANSNPPVIKNYGIGINYLNLCDSATGYCSEEAKDFADGIRLVINGTRNEFGLEYPCNSPIEERWFIGWVTPLLNTDPIHFIISHGNITYKKKIKKAEEEIKSLKERMEFLVSSSPVVIYTSRPGQIFEFTSLSSNTNKVLGYDHSDLISNKIKWIDLIHPEDRDKVSEDFSGLPDKEYASSEYRVRLSNNLYSWIRVDKRLIHSKNGDPAEIVGSILNIDSKRRVEEKILYKLSLENTLNKISLSFTEFTEINDSINLALKELADLVKVDSSLLFKISDDGKLISNTHEWYSEAACSKKEILQDIPAESFSSLLGKLKKNECVILDDVKNLSADASFEKEELRRDKVFAILAVPLFCLGKFYGYIIFNDLKGPHEWIADDIQLLRSAAELISRGIEKVTYEKILVENEEHFRTLVENVGEGVGIVDENENFIFANPAANKIFGIENLVGSNLGEFIINEQFNKILDQTSVRKRGKSSEYEIEIIRPNDEIRYMLVTSSPRIDGNNIYRGAFAVFRDITDRKNAELLVNKYAAELKEANSGKDRLFSFISHDLKNTFHGLLGISDLLENNLASLDKKEINQVGMELNKIVKEQYKQLENLLTWSKMQFGTAAQRLDSCNLKDIAETNLDVLKNYFVKKNINISNKIEDMWVTAEPAVLNSIFQNLILNAIKFTGTSGKITLYTQIKSDYLEVMVKDTGIGISEDNLQKLFNISTHFTLAGTVGESGSGLGLMICKEMVEKMGGKLLVDSKFGEGSTFSFSIPVEKVSNPESNESPGREIASLVLANNP